METKTPSSIHPDPTRELVETIHLGKTLAKQALTDLVAATPVLIDAIRHQSGQSGKLERILWSLWSDSHQINLCSELAGLESRLAQAALAMISARAYLSGDADDPLRKIIQQSGSQAPKNTHNIATE